VKVAETVASLVLQMNVIAGGVKVEAEVEAVAVGSEAVPTVPPAKMDASVGVVPPAVTVAASGDEASNVVAVSEGVQAPVATTTVTPATTTTVTAAASSSAVAEKEDAAGAAAAAVPAAPTAIAGDWVVVEASIEEGMSSQSIVQTPQFQKKTCEPVKLQLHEINKLFNSIPKKSVRAKGKDGMTLPAELCMVTMQKGLLNHLFGMKITQTPNEVHNSTCTPQYLYGFHHVDVDDSNIRNLHGYYIHNFGKSVADGYVLVNEESVPVYKTFFVNISQKEVLKLCLESLQRISSVVDSTLDRWEIKGQSADGVNVTSIVDKKTGSLITCYPTSNLSETEIRLFKNQQRNCFNKRIMNPTCPLLGTREVDSQKLYDYYCCSDMKVDLKFVYCDMKSLEGYGMDYLNGVTQPYMRYSFLSNKFIDDLKSEFPNRQITVLSSLERFILSLETINFLFFSGHVDMFFPKGLSSFEILDCLKESISNYVALLEDCLAESVWEDIEYIEDSWDGVMTREDVIRDPFASNYTNLKFHSAKTGKTGTTWDYLGAPVYSTGVDIKKSNEHALELMSGDLCFGGGYEFEDCEGNSTRTDRRVPTFCYNNHDQNNYICMFLHSNGTCFMDTRGVRILINPITGNINEFSVS
jgi:hypothetical protein